MARKMERGLARQDLGLTFRIHRLVTIQAILMCELCTIHKPSQGDLLGCRFSRMAGMHFVLLTYE